MAETVHLPIAPTPVVVIPTEYNHLAADQAVYTPDAAVAKNSFLTPTAIAELALPVNLEDGDRHGIAILSGPVPPDIGNYIAASPITLSTSTATMDLLIVQRHGADYLIVRHAVYNVRTRFV